MATERNRRMLEVVIVSHGAEALLRRCLRSLAEHPPAEGEMRVTVVDSGSPDATPEMVAREFPQVRLRREGNIGFSAANNIVLRESDADATLLLNPDTEVYAGTLDAALARLRSEPRIGMVGVKLVTESGELDHAAKRSFPTPASALGHFTGLGGGKYRAAHLGDDEPGEVDAVNGAFMLCRAEAIREVGLHVKGGSSASRRAARQEIAFHRGMARFYRRFDAPEHNPLLNAAVYAGIGAKLAISLAITAIRGR